MRILIIRHGDPDYAHDSLTERGFAEAEALAATLREIPIDRIYCSPLGRAQKTAAPTAAALGLTVEILPWLREFPAAVDPPYADCGIDALPGRCPWNMLPQYWTRQSDFYDPKDWASDPLYSSGEVAKVAAVIREGWDELMARHGYIRRGQLYDITDKARRDEVIALFCHLGMGNALLSQITGGSLPFFWQTFFLPTSSVTTVYTEVYPPFPDQCHMRIVGLGDVSHLVRAGLETSSSGLHSDLYSGKMY